MANPFRPTDRIRSFRYAIAGIWTMLASQHNAWIHAAVTVGVVAAGFAFGITSSEWCWLVLAMMAVWIAEALNTAFEFLADVASPEFHPLVEKSKDVAAGAVLIAAVGAAIVGCMVLGPYVLGRASAEHHLDLTDEGRIQNVSEAQFHAVLAEGDATQEKNRQPESPPATSRKKARTVHVFVALCDNRNQGIVPVPATLGNGDDPENNLYWGAMYGVKSFLGKSSKWSLVDGHQNPGDAVLERIIFRDSAGRDYLVADAYRGASIRQATTDFLEAAAGNNSRLADLEGDVLGLYGNADLVAYVGHNGLMDFNPPQIHPATPLCRKEAIVLACKSKPYFLPLLTRLGCRPVLLTTGFMAPEAYTLEAALDAWIADQNSETIRERAARAYHKYQKCGLDGARHLFFSE